MNWTALSVYGVVGFIGGTAAYYIDGGANRRFFWGWNLGMFLTIVAEETIKIIALLRTLP